jgi:hypothetical protein
LQYLLRKMAQRIQKFFLPAWTPVKYAKFFAERHVAEKIAIL